MNLARLMQLLDISMFARFFCEKMSLLLNTLWFRFTAGTSKIFLPLIHAPLTSILSVASIDLVGSLKEYKTEHNREVRMINVAFDGQKLFNWQGDADAVARIDQETKKIARSFNVSPQGLWQLTLVNIDQNGRRFFTSNREAEMMIVTWGLVTMPTKNPDHPGVFGDYLGLWDFDFDIQIDPENNKQFTIEVKSGFVNGVSALS